MTCESKMLFCRDRCRLRLVRVCIIKFDRQRYFVCVMECSGIPVIAKKSQSDDQERRLGLMDNSLYDGYRNPSGGGFNNLGTNAIWWSSSVSGTGSWDRQLNTSYTSVCRNVNARSNGFSVRCVRNLMGMIFTFAASGNRI